MRRHHRRVSTEVSCPRLGKSICLAVVGGLLAVNATVRAGSVAHGGPFDWRQNDNPNLPAHKPPTAREAADAAGVGPDVNPMPPAPIANAATAAKPDLAKLVPEPAVDPNFDDRPLPKNDNGLWVHRPDETVVDKESLTEAGCSRLLGSDEMPAGGRANVLGGRAQARMRLWQPLGALADIRAALRLDQNSMQLHLIHADILSTLGQTDAAAAELQKVFKLDPTSTLAARALGLLHFQTGQFAKAAAELSFHLDDPDAQGLSRSDRMLPVLLAICRARVSGAGLNDPAIRALPANLSAAWPAPIAAMMTGRIDRQQLLAHVSDVRFIATEQAACLAWFYLGERSLLAGDRDRAVRDFLAALRTGYTTAVEYRLAVSELIRLDVLSPNSLPGLSDHS